MDKVFLDANILFSAAYGLSTLDHLWRLSRSGRCTLIASDYVIEEATRNFATKAQSEKLKSYIEGLEIVPEVDPGLKCPVALPEKDRSVLMAAVSAGADYLLTGDLRHFGQYFGKEIMGVRIMMARDFINSAHSDPEDSGSGVRSRPVTNQSGEK